MHRSLVGSLRGAKTPLPQDDKWLVFTYRGAQPRPTPVKLVVEASRAHPFRKERENGGAASIALVQPRSFARFRKILIAEIRF